MSYVFFLFFLPAMYIHENYFVLFYITYNNFQRILNYVFFVQAEVEEKRKIGYKYVGM